VPNSRALHAIDAGNQVKDKKNQSESRGMPLAFAKSLPTRIMRAFLYILIQH
jgi:hypothetical protein